MKTVTIKEAMEILNVKHRNSLTQLIARKKVDAKLTKTDGNDTIWLIDLASLNEYKRKRDKRKELLK